ncbi:MAG: F0F1 ATP synthase subunit A [Fimbriimonadaceae bacterium]
MGELLRLTPGLVATSEAHNSFEGLMVYTGLVVAIVFGALTVAMGNVRAAQKSGTPVFRKLFGGLFEQVYLFVSQMCTGTIGPHGRKYVPMILTFWLIIFVSNSVALFMPTAPTADLSFNLALALMAVGYVQWEGIRANGLVGHLKHFAGPKLTGFIAVVSVMIFAIEIISEVMKNVSLSLRLFGNIEGGHLAVVAMDKLGAPIFVPVGALILMPIKLMTVVVQAMIFTMLTCVYLSLVTHHGDEH